MQGSVRQRYGHWYYSFDVGKEKGQRRRIERFGGNTRGEAETALRKAISEYENGGVPVNLSDMSVNDYFDYWYQNYVLKNLKKNTQVNYLNVINKYIDPAIGKYQLKSVGPAALQKMMNDLGDTSLAKHSVEIILTVLRKGFKMAVFPYQLIKENPGNYVEMPKYDQHVGKTRSDLRIITMKQYQQILAVTPFSNPFNVPLQIGFGTGMRRGEVCGLEWDAVDLENATIDIHQAMLQFSKKKRQEDQKRGSSVKPSYNADGKARRGKVGFEIGPLKTGASYRKILIGQSLVDLLKKKRKDQMAQKLRYGKFYHDSNFVCTKENGDPMTPNSIKYHADKIQRDLGFPFDFHSLRHTHATMLLENGANIKEIQARLGHSRISTTLDTYSHVTKKMSTETVDIFEKMMHHEA